MNDKVTPIRPIDAVQRRTERRKEIAKLPPPANSVFALKLASAVSALTLAAEKRGGALHPPGVTAAIKSMIPPLKK